jgi:hypothetical protein
MNQLNGVQKDSCVLQCYSTLAIYCEIHFQMKGSNQSFPAERFKSWWAYLICSPGWNRVKVATKRWLGRIPIVSLCSAVSACELRLLLSTKCE